MKHPGQRNAQPIRPVGQFVFGLAKGLFDQKEIQHLLGGLRIGRPQPLVGHGVTVGGKEGRGRTITPFGERCGEFSLLVGRYFQRTLQRGGRRIIDRADQAGDIARRGRFAPPFGQRSMGLAVKTDNEDVVLDDQCLTEIEIAMEADIQAFDIMRKQRVKAIVQASVLGQRLIDQCTIGFVCGFALLFQQA